jgi:sulfur-carrier protein
MPSIHIPTAMRQFTENRSVIEVPCGTVAELMTAMDVCAPGLGRQLRDQQGRIKPFIAVFVNDTDIQSLEAEQTPVGERDEVFILPAIAGGAERF